MIWILIAAFSLNGQTQEVGLDVFEDQAVCEQMAGDLDAQMKERGVETVSHCIPFLTEDESEGSQQEGHIA